MRNEIDSRREKLAEEMRSREMKFFENRKGMELEKRNKLKITKKKIEEKDKKVKSKTLKNDHTFTFYFIRLRSF